jgi:hypothetical protein
LSWTLPITVNFSVTGTSDVHVVYSTLSVVEFVTAGKARVPIELSMVHSGSDR